MTDEVGELVLRDNYEQNLALANAAANAPVAAARPRGLDAQARARRACSTASSRACRPRKAVRRRGSSAATGLTAPELSVLLAWTKIVLAEELLDSDLPDDPFLRTRPDGLLPDADARGLPRAAIGGHPLRREIIVTQVVNDLVNGAGMTFWPRLAGETGATAGGADPRQLRGPRDLRLAARCATRSRPSTTSSTPPCQTRMRLEMRTLVERASRWLVNNRRPPLDSRGHGRATSGAGAGGDGAAAASC